MLPGQISTDSKFKMTKIELLAYLLKSFFRYLMNFLVKTNRAAKLHSASMLRMSRVDYYGGMVKTFQRGDIGEFGTTFKARGLRLFGIFFI